MANRTNPFEKYLSKEQVMQAEVVRLLQLKFPSLFWWHTENEGNRTPFEQYVFKEMGGKSGISDFIILEEGNFSKGLMIEIKWGKGTCSKSQVSFLIESAKRGYTSCVVYDDARDVISLVERHLNAGVIIPSDGILLIRGGKETVVPFDQAEKVLYKKPAEKDVKAKAKELFKKEAIKKFGKVSDRSKLFNHRK